MEGIKKVANSHQFQPLSTACETHTYTYVYICYLCLLEKCETR